MEKIKKSVIATCLATCLGVSLLIPSVTHERTLTSYAMDFGTKVAVRLFTDDNDYEVNTNDRLDRVNGADKSTYDAVVPAWQTQFRTDFNWNTATVPADVLAGSEDGKVLNAGLFSWGFTSYPYISLNEEIKITDVKSVTFRIYAHLYDATITGATSYLSYNGHSFANSPTMDSTKTSTENYGNKTAGGIYFYNSDAVGDFDEGILLDPYIVQDEWTEFTVTGSDIEKLADSTNRISGFYFASALLTGETYQLYQTTNGNDPNSAQARIYIDSITVSKHVPQRVKGQAATAEADGWKDYYYCPDCNAHYEDNRCETAIPDVDAWKVGAGKIGFVSHTIVKQDGKPATCTEDGWKEYYYCTDDGCGEVYEDEQGKTLISDLDAWKVGEGKLVAKWHNYENGVCTLCGEAKPNLVTSTIFSADADYTTDSEKRLETIEGIQIGSVLNWNTIPWNDTYLLPNQSEIVAGSSNGQVLKTAFVSWGYTKLPYVKFNTSVPASEVFEITFRLYAHLSAQPGYGGYDGTKFADGSTKGIYFYGDNANAGKEGGVLLDPMITQDQWVDFTISGSDVAKLADDEGNISGFYLGALIFSGSSDQFYVTTNGDSHLSTEALLFIDSVNVSLVSDGACEHAQLQRAEGQSATCETAGWKDYYVCQECGAAFEDAEGTKAISDLTVWKTGDGKIVATGHSFSGGECTACGKSDPDYSGNSSGGASDIVDNGNNSQMVIVVCICCAAAVVVAASVAGSIILNKKIRQLNASNDASNSGASNDVSNDDASDDEEK